MVGVETMVEAVVRIKRWRGLGMVLGFMKAVVELMMVEERAMKFEEKVAIWWRMWR